MISKKVAKTVLNNCLKTGADFAEIFLEETFKSSLLKNKPDVINEATTAIEYGAGIRILKDLQSVYGYTNDISKEGLCKLASDLASRFEGKKTHKVNEFKDEEPKVYNYKKTSVSNAYKTRLVNKAYKACKGKNPKIAQVSITLLETNQKVWIINTDGLWTSDWRFRVRMGISAVAAANGEMQVAFEGPGAEKGYEFFEEDINVKEIAKEAAKSALVALKAKECPSAKMDVVIDNGFGGVIFHEACGHSLEATSVAKNLSVFSGKLGQKIASDIVSAYDDGTIENGWGSGKIDDEGNPTQRTCLIENGVLKNYLVDNQNGRRMNQKGNGACRRQSYKYQPTSRMSNTFIANGTSTVEEIIASTKKGLYAKKLGGGSVNPLTGEFNFAVNEAYLIKNGKIGRPVKGATLVGKGHEILFNIDMVGNNLKRAQGMCGSSSGSIPADVGQPCIRVKNVTVGGRGK